MPCARSSNTIILPSSAPSVSIFDAITTASAATHGAAAAKLSRKTRASPARRARMLRVSAPSRLHDELRVGKLAALHHNLIVEQHGAIDHRRVDMALGVALAAHIVVRPGREQEIARENARRGIHAVGLIAVQDDVIPEGMRMHAEAEMRDGVGIEIVLALPIAVEPMGESFGVEAAFDLADEAVADFKPHRLLDQADIGQDEEIAGLQHHRAIGATFIGIIGDMAGAPLVDAARRFGETVLALHLELAARPGEVGTGIAQQADFLRIAPALGGMQHGLLEAGWRLQPRQLIWRDDD